MKEQHIKIKKGRFSALFAMGLVLLLLSFMLVFWPSFFQSEWIQSKVLIVCSGLVGVFFFGLTSLYLGRKLANSQLGIHLSEDGILDLTSVFRFDWVAWQDIQSFELENQGSFTGILIHVSNPEKYVDQLDSPVFRKAAEKNISIYGTPLMINTKILNMSSVQLLHLLDSSLQEQLGQNKVQ